MKSFRLLCREKATKPMTPLNAIAQGMIDQGYTLEQATQHFQRVYIQRVGIGCNGNATRTASMLAIHRNTLTRILHNLGMPIVQPRKRSQERAV